MDCPFRNDPPTGFLASDGGMPVASQWTGGCSPMVWRQQPYGLEAVKHSLCSASLMDYLCSAYYL